MHPYPATAWCPLPAEDRTNKPMCRPLPVSVKPPPVPKTGPGAPPPVGECFRLPLLICPPHFPTSPFHCVLYPHDFPHDLHLFPVLSIDVLTLFFAVPGSATWVSQKGAPPTNTPAALRGAWVAKQVPGAAPGQGQGRGNGKGKKGKGKTIPANSAAPCEYSVTLSLRVSSCCFFFGHVYFFSCFHVRLDGGYAALFGGSAPASRLSFSQFIFCRVSGGVGTRPTGRPTMPTPRCFICLGRFCPRFARGVAFLLTVASRAVGCPRVLSLAPFLPLRVARFRTDDASG